MPVSYKLENDVLFYNAKEQALIRGNEDERDYRYAAGKKPARTATGAGSVSKRLNTSAEEEGLAGLVALSSATFLRMDES